MMTSVSPLMTGRDAATKRGRLAVAVADVTWFNTENLFREEIRCQFIVSAREKMN